MFNNQNEIRLPSMAVISDLLSLIGNKLFRFAILRNDDVSSRLQTPGIKDGAY